MILYFFAFLAGFITVLSPCILPVLPAVLSAGIGKGRYRPLGIIIGLIVSFVFFTLTLTYLVHSIGISANILRYSAIIIIALFGAVMLFPSLGDIFARSTTSLSGLGAKIQSHSIAQGTGFISGLFIGVALGLLWTPCAGPILAVVTTFVATQQVTKEIILITIAYSLGSGIPLLLIAYGGNKAITTIPFLARHAEGIKKIFGALMILSAVALYFNLEVYLQQVAIKYIPTLEFEKNEQIQRELGKLRSSPFTEQNINALKKEQGLDLPKIAPAPEIIGISKWINSMPLELSQLHGKVVLIDFWTYSCINCIRTFPYLKNWYDNYKDKGFVIIGVHTPEFEFEKDSDNVEKAVKRFGILYPVALDNQYKTWQNYSNLYWPAHYLIDQNGIVRQVHFGEGKYMETENAIRTLLGLSPIQGQESKISSRPITPETYLGIDRAKQYQPDIQLKLDETAFYKYTPPLQNDQIGLKGQWLVGKEKITSMSDESTLDLNFLATRVYLVMDAETPQNVTVLLNGSPLPKKYQTDDMNDAGEILVKEARKYDVINLKGEYGRHVVSLKIPKGVSAYAFTFGDEP